MLLVLLDKKLAIDLSVFGNLLPVEFELTLVLISISFDDESKQATYVRFSCSDWVILAFFVDGTNQFFFGDISFHVSAGGSSSVPNEHRLTNCVYMLIFQTIMFMVLLLKQVFVRFPFCRQTVGTSSIKM